LVFIDATSRKIVHAPDALIEKLRPYSPEWQIRHYQLYLPADDQTLEEDTDPKPTSGRMGPMVECYDFAGLDGVAVVDVYKFFSYEMRRNSDSASGHGL
jgi:hypothetical protein